MKQSDTCIQFPKMFCIVFITTCIVALQGNTAAAFTSPASRIVPRVNANVNANSNLLPAQHRQSWANNNKSIKPKLATVSMTTSNETPETSSGANVRKRQMPKMLMNVYINYITKLWRQTDPEEREKVAAKQALSAIQRVKHIMEGEEYVDFSNVNENDTLDDVDARIQARDELLAACANMLECMEKVEVQAPAMEINESEAKEQAIAAPKKKKNSRSVFFGAAMGAMVCGWVFSGNFVFTTLFTLMTALGQLEYYRMVMKTGIYPARRISVLGACSMFVTVSWNR